MQSFPKASRKAARAAISKAITEESTSWAGAIDQCRLEVDNRETSNRARFETLLQAFFDTRVQTHAGSMCRAERFRIQNLRLP